VSDFVASIYSSYNAAAFARLLANDPAPPAIAVAGEHPLLAGGRFAAGELPPPQGDLCVVLTSPGEVLASFARLERGDALDGAALDGDVDAFCAAAGRLAGGAPIVLVATWLGPYARSGGLLALDPSWGIDAALARANRRLADNLRALHGCYALNAGAWVSALGAKSFSAKNWFLTKDPFTFEHWNLAVVDVKTAVAALTGHARKLLIVDLDNTLWGGEVGDAGLDGLRLGGHDAAGEAYVAFQRALLALARRGVVLAVASKNDEAVALAAIDRHPEMVLRRDDFAGWRINWDEKAENIAALCRELELSPADAVFIDDNPGERARVARALPELTVPEWPANPMLFVEALGRLNAFDVPAVTAEDLGRGRSYAARRLRAADPGDDGVTITIEPLGAADAVRALQLLNKTNQMNLTTRRLGEREFAAERARSDWGAWVVRVADRFADYGLTGFFALEFGPQACAMTDFVMSCRVMARGVEERMLAAAAEAAAERGCPLLRLRFGPTERNEPMRRFLHERSGLTTTDGVEYARPSGVVGAQAG
jgi:FkbH-like protein